MVQIGCPLVQPLKHGSELFVTLYTKHLPIRVLSYSVITGTTVAVNDCTGQCCWPGEEPCSHGVHLLRLAAIANLGVPGRMEYGEPRGNCSVCHCRVRYDLCLRLA